MTTDAKLQTAHLALSGWLKNQNIDPSTVGLTLFFATEDDRIRAAYTLAKEIGPSLKSIAPSLIGSGTLAGISFKFAVKPDPRALDRRRGPDQASIPRETGGAMTTPTLRGRWMTSEARKAPPAFD